MQYLELFSHQAATAVVGVGANELRQPCVELQPLVGEPLPDQARRGDYGAGLGFLDNGEIRGVASWMVPRHQVARTSSYPPVGFSPPRRIPRGTVHPGVERRHRLGILLPCSTQDQATA